MHKRYGALSSSVNPMELAQTVVGIIKFLAGTAATFGVLTVSDVDAVTVATEGILAQVAVIVPAAYAVWGFAEAVFGVFRKIVVWVSERT